ncbi:MAG: hypothetical protein HYX25_01235 [Candidatus Solibacter usitatus]|nr:hypothetical protein [Candidatus Solibacter usitatus]
MSMPPIPTLLDHLGNRPVSFYPPILNIEHNEWFFRRATWSELLVVNSRTAQEIWIPRRFLGEISQIEDPVVIVGLVKELEYRMGAVWPYQRRVIEMPIAVGDTMRTAQRPLEAPAPVVGIRLESSTDSRIGRLILVTVAIGIVASLVAITVLRDGIPRPRIRYTASDQDFLQLGRDDDYFAVVRKLGAPSAERWQTETGEIQYRGLWYKGRGYIVILMGGNRRDARYIGTVDDNWNPVHDVALPSGGTTRSMLRGIKKF